MLQAHLQPQLCGPSPTALDAQVPVLTFSFVSTRVFGELAQSISQRHLSLFQILSSLE
jgi:hypothetical protein